MSVVPSNPKDREKLKLAVGEITKCLLRIDGEREAVKEIIAAASEEYEIDKKLIRKVANTMYKHNYADKIAEEESFQLLYESIIEGKKSETA